LQGPGFLSFHHGSDEGDAGACEFGFEPGGSVALVRDEDLSRPVEVGIDGDHVSSDVSFPYIAVTDVYPNGGDICFREYVTGRVPNPSNGIFVFAILEMDGPIDNFDDPLDGDCGTFGDDADENAYALTFSIGN
jgi:hypothetical protein